MIIGVTSPVDKSFLVIRFVIYEFAIIFLAFPFSEEAKNLYRFRCSNTTQNLLFIIDCIN